MKSCNLLIGPKGPRYSQISDDEFENFKTNDDFHLSQISPEIYIAWQFNAKTLEDSYKIRVVDPSIPRDEITADEMQLIHSYSSQYHINDFATEVPFPITNGQSGSLDTSRFRTWADDNKYIAFVGSHFFLHRDNFYHYINRSRLLGSSSIRTASINLNKITLIETLTSGTETYTYTHNWKITEKFYT